MNFLEKHKTIISIAVGFVMAVLFLNQCNKTQQLKSEKENLKQEMKQHKAALKDSSAIIQTKKDEIYLYDALLQQAYYKIDSLENVTPEQVTTIKIKYKDTTPKTVPNQITTNKGRTGTKFSFSDNIMSFDGISFFNIETTNDSFNITNDSTKIYNRKLNFGISTYQYRNDGILKVGAKPYKLKENGKFGEELTELNLQTRSAIVKTEEIEKPTTNKFVPTISIGGGPMYPIGPNEDFAVGAGIFIGYGRRLDK